MVCNFDLRKPLYEWRHTFIDWHLTSKSLHRNLFEKVKNWVSDKNIKSLYSSGNILI